jgi:hypothetical protein
MKCWILCAALLSSGCATVFTSFERTLSPARVESREGVLQPQRSVNQLLIERLTLCSAPTEEQDALLAQNLKAKGELLAGGVDEAKLNALLLASCKPARTPGVLNQLLAELTAAGTWPEEYAAFFDMLISGQRAYASVEKVYVDLEKAYGDLKHEHEKTIQGLSEIETQIELQTVNSVP